MAGRPSRPCQQNQPGQKQHFMFVYINNIYIYIYIYKLFFASRHFLMAQGQEARPAMVSFAVYDPPPFLEPGCALSGREQVFFLCACASLSNGRCVLSWPFHRPFRRPGVRTSREENGHFVDPVCINPLRGKWALSHLRRVLSRCCFLICSLMPAAFQQQWHWLLVVAVAEGCGGCGCGCCVARADSIQAVPS